MNEEVLNLKKKIESLQKERNDTFSKREARIACINANRVTIAELNGEILRLENQNFQMQHESKNLGDMLKKIDVSINELKSSLVDEILRS